MANGKKMFIKLPARIELFKNKVPDTSFPPSSSNYMLENLVGCHHVLCRKL
jgi:hypothetical protein